MRSLFPILLLLVTPVVLFALPPNLSLTVEPDEGEAGEGINLLYVFDFGGNANQWVYDSIAIQFPQGWSNVSLQRAEIVGEVNLFLQRGDPVQPGADGQAIWRYANNTLILRMRNGQFDGAGGGLELDVFAEAPEVVRQMQFAFTAFRRNGINPGNENNLAQQNIAFTITPSDPGGLALLAGTQGENPLQGQRIGADGSVAFRVVLNDVYDNRIDTIAFGDLDECIWTGPGAANFSSGQNSSVNFYCRTAGTGRIVCDKDGFRVTSEEIVITPAADLRPIIGLSDTARVHVANHGVLTADEALILYVRVVDQFANWVRDVVPADNPQWTFNNGHFSADHPQGGAYFRFQANRPAQNSVLRVSYDGVNSGNLTVAQIVAGALAELQVKQNNNRIQAIDVRAGELKQNLRIFGYDRDANETALGQDLAWRTSGLDSAKNGNNRDISALRFRRAPQQGALLVQSGGVGLSIPITVNPDAAASMFASSVDTALIEVEDQWIEVGETLNFYGHALDQYGNWNDGAVQWNNVNWNLPNVWGGTGDRNLAGRGKSSETQIHS